MTRSTIKLQAPFVIGSRLWPALRIGDATLTIRLPLYRAEQGRTGAAMILEAPGLQFTDQTIRSRIGGFRSLVDPFAAYLSFLEAAAEAREGGDNADLFPAKVMQWARDNAAVIAEARMELCDESGAARHELIAAVQP